MPRDLGGDCTLLWFLRLSLPSVHHGSKQQVAELDTRCLPRVALLEALDNRAFSLEHPIESVRRNDRRGLV